MIPTPIDIDKKDWDALLKAQTEIVTLQQMMDMFIQNCQARMTNVQMNTREIWGRLAEKHGLDLNRVAWEPDLKQPKIIPTGINLRKGALSGPSGAVG